MGFLTRLFGQSGKIRFEGETENGDKFSGKMEIECFNVDNSELIDRIKNILYVEKGWCIKSLKLTGFYER